jgi:hypothetical protein
VSWIPVDSCISRVLSSDSEAMSAEKAECRVLAWSSVGDPKLTFNHSTFGIPWSRMVDATSSFSEKFTRSFTILGRNLPGVVVPTSSAMKSKFSSYSSDSSPSHGDLKTVLSVSLLITGLICSPRRSVFSCGMLSKSVVSSTEGTLMYDGVRVC